MAVDPFENLCWIFSFRHPILVNSLHDCATAAALLRCVWVFALGNDTPDRGNHVVSGAIAVGDDAARQKVSKTGAWVGEMCCKRKLRYLI